MIRMVVTNFKEAVNSLESMLEIDEFAILEGEKVSAILFYI